MVPIPTQAFDIRRNAKSTVLGQEPAESKRYQHDLSGGDEGEQTYPKPSPTLYDLKASEVVNGIKAPISPAHARRKRRMPLHEDGVPYITSTERLAQRNKTKVFVGSRS